MAKWDEDVVGIVLINFCSLGTAILAMCCIGFVGLIVWPQESWNKEYLLGLLGMTLFGCLPLGLYFVCLHLWFWFNSIPLSYLY